MEKHGTVYDVEMQTTRDSLEKRARFYQSAIDRNELDKGSLYAAITTIMAMGSLFMRSNPDSKRQIDSMRMVHMSSF